MLNAECKFTGKDFYVISTPFLFTGQMYYLLIYWRVEFEEKPRFSLLGVCCLPTTYNKYTKLIHDYKTHGNAITDKYITKLWKFLSNESLATIKLLVDYADWLPD